MRHTYRLFVASGLLAAAAVLVGLVPSQVAGQSITIGPYIQNPSTTSMTVQYITDASGDGTVKYGAGKALDQQVKATLHEQVASGGACIYIARLTGLKPDTVYQYQVQPAGSSAGASIVRKFHTFPEKADAVTFIAYGDTRTNAAAHAKVAANFNKHNPAFILHVGDIVEKGGTYSLWPAFFKAVADSVDHVPMMFAIGNHEGGAANLLRMFDMPGGRTYFSFDHGPVHVVVLDSYQQGAAVLQWLDQDLAASKAPWKVAMYHEPSFNFGGHHSKSARQTFLPLFVKYGVDVVFTGHSHLYERFKPLVADAAAGRVITFITTGGGGAPLAGSVQNAVLAKTASTYEYCAVAADATTFRIEAFESSGKPLDALTITKKDGKYDKAYLDQAIPMDEAVKATSSGGGGKAAP